MNWPWDAHVGQEVVCIDDSPMWNIQKCLWKKPPITKGRIYVIVEIEPNFGSLYFVLCHNTKARVECSRFRPLDKSKTQDTIDKLKEVELEDA